MSCVWVLQRGHSGDGYDLASTLCKYDLRKGDLFVLSWARVRQVRSPLASDTNINKLQITQTTALRISNECTIEPTHNIYKTKHTYYP